MKKKLGIIGGMGPLAAADFYRNVVMRTEAGCDQDHIVTFMISDPEVPRRVEYILGESTDSPGPRLISIAKELERMGAEVIAMPCVTAHFFYKDIRDAVSVPVLNMLEEGAAALKDRGVGCAGILATKATLKSGIVQDALRLKGIDSILPTDEENEIISDLIFKEIKTGKRTEGRAFLGVMEALRNRGAQKCLVSCTDLSAFLHGIFPDGNEGHIDLMDILAEAAVRECIL